MNDHTGIEMDLDRILKLQHELSRILADAVDPLAGLAAAVELAASIPSVDGVWIWFRHDDDGEFVLGDVAGLCDELTMELDVFPTDTPVARRLLAQQESVGTWEDLWPEKAAAIRQFGWKQVAVLPVISQGQVVGALGAGRRTSECVDSNCLWVLRSLANAIGSLVTGIRAETHYRTVSQNLSTMLNSFSDRMFIVDGEGTVLYHNHAAAGGPQACWINLVGSNIELTLPGFNRLRKAVASVEVLAEQPIPALPLQSTMIDGSGARMPVELRIDKGSWDGSPADIVVCRDTTSHQILTKENQRLVTAINHVADSIVITDAKGTIQYVNPAFCAMTGYSRHKVLGVNPRVLKSGHHSAEFYRDMWQTLASGEIWSGRLVNRRKNGELYTEDTTISPVLDESGEITHYVAAKRDVTREVGMEERLHEAQKMEAVGTLAGGIAHDFNNILYALLGYADLAMDDIPAGHPAHTPLEEITKAGNRAASLVAKMLTFGRRSDGLRELVAVTDVFDRGLELVRATLPATIRIETDLTSAAGRIEVDTNQIHQVLLNLCANAQYAMRGEGGLLRIAVETVELDRRGASAVGRLQPGTWARIRVSDTGHGIDPAVMERIFEPYFTTRKSNEGTGLGLATVHGIITAHGGRVTVASEFGVGSEFTIHLPVHATGERTPAVPGHVGKEPSTGHGHIMVIDDESMVLKVLQKAMERFGYEVTGFADGIEALEVFRTNPDQYDVVVTDQSMPNITGYELATQMLAIRPDLPMVLTTGHSDEMIHEQARAAGIRYYLPKPISMTDLGEVLEELTNQTTTV